MSLVSTYEDPYFANLGNNVEMNRCPKCSTGMVIDTPCDRQCPKCGYSDSSNVPLKVRLKFELVEEVTKNNIRECNVIAKEPSGKISFVKEFVDRTTAQVYMERMKTLCL